MWFDIKTISEYIGKIENATMKLDESKIYNKVIKETCLIRQVGSE